jgi:hypothetical protein
MTAQRLFAWAKRNPTKFSCCAPNLAIADAYNGGSTFMAFLAEEFGEGIHAKLLQNSANTFEAGLTRSCLRAIHDRMPRLPGYA